MSSAASQKDLKYRPTRTIALAGNPNSGKTTLFNAFTKLRQKVGNYPGVTVEKKSGRFVLQNQKSVNVIDLPGTYSLAVRSPDERVARDVLLGRMDNTSTIDLVVCVVDAGNLERNLYLVTQIMDLGIPVVVALNMMDEAKRKGLDIDIKKLSSQLGVPVVAMVANKNEGIEDLKEIINQPEYQQHQRKWFMPQAMEEEVSRLASLLQEKYQLSKQIAFSEVLMLLALSKNQSVEEQGDDNLFADKEIVEQVNCAVESLLHQGIKSRTASIEARYRWIKSVIKGVVKRKGEMAENFTNKLDGILTHKVWGWVAFVSLMAFMFFMIFSVATYPMEWIDSFFSHLSGIVAENMAPGDFRDLITNGVIAGVGGVVIFLPQILILFFFIGLLQDTGYMARAAFIMDRVMSKMGLHGKSFIPLLSSFACAIPGIMAARTIENSKDRLVTILVAPLMSCSARLPVYTILIAVLLPSASAFEKAGLLLMLYLLGMIGVGVMAWLFKKTLLKGQKPVFIMELPPYRFPSFKTVFLHMWERSRLFLKRAGTIILLMSIVLWVLMSYPKTDAANESSALKQSYAGQMGTALEPVLKPLGYDWRIGIGLIGSFAAREVFVSTMSIVFNLDEGDAKESSLRGAFVKARWPDGRRLFTPLVCLSLMVFFVFAMQCLSTIAIVVRETNGWKWPLFQIGYMTFLAYTLSLLVFQGGRLLGFQ